MTSRPKSVLWNTSATKSQALAYSGARNREPSPANPHTLGLSRPLSRKSETADLISNGSNETCAICEENYDGGGRDAYQPGACIHDRIDLN